MKTVSNCDYFQFMFDIIKNLFTTLNWSINRE